ncbi:MAG: hypothetical protein ABI378_15765 [Chitinophagaceae bacterium]
MTKSEKHNNLKEKLLFGLELAYKRMIEFKKQKNSVIVVMRDNKIVYLKPEEA